MLLISKLRIWEKAMEKYLIASFKKMQRGTEVVIAERKLFYLLI